MVPEVSQVILYIHTRSRNTYKAFSYMVENESNKLIYTCSSTELSYKRKYTRRGMPGWQALNTFKEETEQLCTEIYVQGGYTPVVNIRRGFLLPYSGLFLWGANFRYFCGLPTSHENFHRRIFPPIDRR